MYENGAEVQENHAIAEFSRGSYDQLFTLFIFPTALALKYSLLLLHQVKDHQFLNLLSFRPRAMHKVFISLVGQQGKEKLTVGAMSVAGSYRRREQEK